MCFATSYFFLSWKPLQLVCTVPLLFIYACYKIIPESPRWMVTKGLTTGAREVIEKISEANKVEVPHDLQEKLTEMAEETKEKALGFASLFSTWTLAIR